MKDYVKLSSFNIIINHVSKPNHTVEHSVQYLCKANGTFTLDPLKKEASRIQAYKINNINFYHLLGKQNSYGFHLGTQWIIKYWWFSPRNQHCR